jgi:uncharacterized protein YdeI (YjbR/CyaY-like superfamily)
VAWRELGCVVAAMALDAVFFDDADAWLAWLAEWHATENELLLGFYKRGSGQDGMSYAAALDAALCYGWIDGTRKRIDDASYAIRFSPRKPGSIWSAVNVARAGELAEQGRLQPAGLRAFNARNQTRDSYSYEGDAATRALDAVYERQFREHATAWAFFQAQAPSYQKAANWWVMSAKRAETRVRRLQQLIEVSEQDQRLGHLVRQAKPPT